MKKALCLVLVFMMAVSLAASAAADAAISYGDKGANVKRMQKMLITLGFLEGKADGVYGQQTQDAVEYFLLWNGTEDGKEMDAESLAILENVIRIAEGKDTDQITDEQKALYPVCQPGKEGNEICWRHMRTNRVFGVMNAGYPPQKMEAVLLRRARQNWIEDILQLYDEWALSDPKTAKKQKADFQRTIKRMKNTWQSKEKKLKDDDLIDYLWEQYRWIEGIGVNLCFDLHTTENGN